MGVVKEAGLTAVALVFALEATAEGRGVVMGGRRLVMGGRGLATGGRGTGAPGLGGLETVAGVTGGDPTLAATGCKAGVAATTAEARGTTFWAEGTVCPVGGGGGGGVAEALPRAWTSRTDCRRAPTCARREVTASASRPTSAFTSPLNCATSLLRAISALPFFLPALSAMSTWLCMVSTILLTTCTCTERSLAP